MPSHFDEAGHPTRKTKVRWLCQQIPSKGYRQFVQTDIESALELIGDSRWWNRRRHRLMASALVACAEEMECAADAGGRRDTAETEDGSISRPALVADAG